MSEPVRPSFPLGTLRELLGRLRVPWLRPEPADRPDPEGDARERLRVQVGVIRRAFGGEVAAAAPEGPRPPKDDADAYFLYHPSRALVREEDVEAVTRFFDDAGERFRGGVERLDIRKIPLRQDAARDRPEREPLPGVAVLAFPERTDEADRVLATIEELDAEIRDGIATPDHVLYVTVKGHFCPATEPETTRSTQPWPPQSSDATAGSGVRVGVVDTGLWTDAVGSQSTPWMTDVYADHPDVEQVNTTAIHEYAGHGTFVAGVVKCLAPDSRVEVEGALPHGGAVFESAICQQLHEALVDGDHPQLISISAGTHTRKNIALLAFEILAAEHGLDDGEATLVVAAAGNDGNKEPFWPAAFPWVVGVGSVDSDGNVSTFSNYGDWVDVYARGSKLVNAFPVGTYTCTEPPNVGQVRTFKGLAQWSGTSFATPIVTGLIAARMSAASENALAARQAVLGSGASGVDPDGNPIRTVGPLS